MKNQTPLLPLSLCLALLAVGGFAPPAAVAISSCFTYQGCLTVDGVMDPMNRFDLRFKLFDAATGGNQIGPPVTAAPVNQISSFFLPTGWVLTVPLDFGTNASIWIDGNARWLEIEVRPASTNPSAPYTLLSPRQQITSVPYATFAATAGTLTGPVSPAQLPSTVARLDLPQTFTAAPLFNSASGPPFAVGTTGRVQNLNADLLDGMDATAFWPRQVFGPVWIIGTDYRSNAIEVMLGAERALRLQPGDANGGSSLVGGQANNSIATGVPGSVVAGGRGNLIRSNASYSTVTGGSGNEIGVGARESVIGGGAGQVIGPSSIYAGVFAGYGNTVSSNSRFAGVLLGSSGIVRETSDFSAVLSGDGNSVGPATYSAIVSGAANRIESGAYLSLIASGQWNVVSTQAYFSAIVGGQLNKIQPGAQQSFVGGGGNNQIGPSSYNAFLGGGGGNKIETSAPYSAILAGQNNLVRTNAGWATVLGGIGSVAGGSFAIAAGHQAKAEHTGSIVLADGQYADFPSLRANEFAVRAAGGVRLETGGAGLTVDGSKLTRADGVLLLPAGSVAASNLVEGAVLTALLPYDGVGSGLDADRLDGLSSEDFWRLTGNAGTRAGVHFLGTTDDQPLELKVNNQLALRLEPNAESPNLIGGYSGNRVDNEAQGATISGGGRADGHPLNGVNRVSASYATIGGGSGNTVRGGSTWGTIGGGERNTIEVRNDWSTIGGGFVNTIGTNAWEAAIGGGCGNTVGTDADSATIGGGFYNTIQTNADFATIPGGKEAQANNYGQMAYASGQFDNPGDAQTSVYVLRTTTSGVMTNELFLDGRGRRLQLQPHSTMTFDVQVAARSSGGSAAGFQFRGVIECSSESVTHLLTLETVMAHRDGGVDLNFLVEKDDDNDALVLKAVQSNLPSDVRWVATVRSTEVKW